MPAERPKNIDQYIGWLKEEHGVTISGQIEKHFELVALNVRERFDESELWKRTLKQLKTSHETYELRHQSPLLARPDETLKLHVKSFNSFLLKTFRWNVLANDRWPEQPAQGWTLPENWFSRVNDIVRTTITVRYLDGVAVLLRDLQDFCTSLGAGATTRFVGTPDGYYAGHLYIRSEFEVPRMTFDTERVDMDVEVHVTTQIHEVIRQLLHGHFEQRRRAMPVPPESWQWDYGSDEFRTNYLGHVLHFVDGMIVDLRDRAKKGDDV